MGIRLAVLDDNPHVAWRGRVHPVDATFHRFLAALLDVEGRPVEELLHVVPVRRATADPGTPAVDPRLRTVPTAPFPSIADYLRRLPSLTLRNRGPIRDAVRAADLVLLRLPASNAALTAVIAAREGRPRFGYIAGSAREVAAGRSFHGPSRLAALGVGSLYDLVSALAAGRGRSLRVGEALLSGGVVTSLVEPDEVRGASALHARPDERGDAARLAWAGRLVPGKGLETLLEALAALPPAPSGGRVTLDVLGDGPHRGELEALAARLGVADAVAWHGHVADRERYLALLEAADAFVFPSPAEGFPKVVLDAAAVGLPVVASPVGALRELADRGLIVPVAPGDAAALASAVTGLLADRPGFDALRAAGLAFAADHTRAAEARRLVARLQALYPSLPWG